MRKPYLTDRIILGLQTIAALPDLSNSTLFTGCPVAIKQRVAEAAIWLKDMAEWGKWKRDVAKSRVRA
jgi:hypothetical protein